MSKPSFLVLMLSLSTACRSSTPACIGDSCNGAAPLTIESLTGDSATQPDRIANGLKIVGRGFGAQPAVALEHSGGTLAFPVTEASDTQLIATVPSSALGLTGELQVTSQSGAVARQGITILRGEAGPAGPPGAPGAPGAAAPSTTPALYGNGSAGPLNINTDTDWTSADANADSNFQFSSCAIGAGSTLHVPSGTVIRCTGDFELAGNITVDVGTSAGRGGAHDTNIYRYPGNNATYHPAHAGLSLVAAGVPGIGTGNVYGAYGGQGLKPRQARFIVRHGVTVGGAGSGQIPSDGGGGVTIIAQGTIHLSGAIDASALPADAGGGGGAGGMVVLAAGVAVQNDGSIYATGGNGGPSNVAFGAGGGGGGGIVHFIAPTVTEGSVDVGAGAAGSTAVAITDTNRVGGGGGGALGGNGGTGASISGANVQSGQTAGSAGYVLVSRANPMGVF